MSQQNNDWNDAEHSRPAQSASQDAKAAQTAGSEPAPRSPADPPSSASDSQQPGPVARPAQPAQPSPAVPDGWRPVSPPPAGGRPYDAAGSAYAPATVASPRRSRAWIVALVAVVLAFVLMAMGIHSCTTVLSPSPGSASTSDAVDALGQDAIAVITVNGTIQYDGSASSPEGLKALLDEAEDSSRVRAVVLRVDSGGGTATAGEEMAGYLRDFSKPVVVSSASTNASAAYEISSQADYIYVAKTTAIGSIGTVMQITDTSELMDMLGINVQDIVSSGSKDSSYGTRPLTDEERAYYQKMVDQINETFIQNVASGRGMSVEEVRALATGLPFTGLDAVENGLADEIGTKEDAVDKAADLAGVTDYTVIDLELDSDDLSMMLDLLY